jgi:hypothetical protein
MRESVFRDGASTVADGPGHSALTTDSERVNRKSRTAEVLDLMLLIRRPS